jgi:hypothetical protein
MVQWHPLFAKLLRPVVETHYEVQTGVPVGDVPLQADIVLLRRTTPGPLPFHGLWSRLTTWNVLEFKGPTVSPRLRDLDLLVELGLGIDRRLNEDRVRRHLPPLAPGEVSFWYLANRLGRRLLRDAGPWLGPLVPDGPGVWRSLVLQRPVYLVSGAHLPVDEDSLPVHLVGREPPEAERQVGRFLAERPGLWQRYGQWLAALHPDVWKEVRVMARRSERTFKIDLRPVIEELGLKPVIEAVGVKEVIDEVGLKEVLKEVGLKEVLKEVGLKEVLKEVGLRQVIESAGLDELIAHLTPAERRELKRRLR